jgi:hypothetical protein
VNQRVELDARDLLLKEIFETNNTLAHILGDNSVGIPFITKILATGCVSTDERGRLCSLVKKSFSRKSDSNGNVKRLLDEISSDSKGSFSSPDRTMASEDHQVPPKYPSHLKHSSLPTPDHSPSHGISSVEKMNIF